MILELSDLIQTVVQADRIGPLRMSSRFKIFFLIEVDFLGLSILKKIHTIVYSLKLSVTGLFDDSTFKSLSKMAFTQIVYNII